ncbi:hypothetical protein FEI15_14505 [Lacticaseibacillus zeae]|uniref:Uncharacterized protein n=1 Tax=Lacticaseibacillus zeae TaxID=57037 RepID=A0A5R8LHP8_LACZE|nr:hypothetical protein [Lacticaseibacillus zeae]TLF36648.1 hypothetical protein FEI15_14505 [Lacticaseibacillus zeae]
MQAGEWGFANFRKVKGDTDVEKPIINSIYFTKKDEHNPLLTFPVKSGKSVIDIHVQVINFTLGKHVLTVSITDQNGNIKLQPSQQTLDASSLKTVGSYGIVDATLFVVFDSSELNGVSRLKFDISFDDAVEATAYLYISREANND